MIPHGNLGLDDGDALGREKVSGTFFAFGHLFDQSGVAALRVGADRNAR
jgi:hypothetical protein